MAGYFTDLRKFPIKIGFTSNMWSGLVETRYFETERHELVNSFRSGPSIQGREIVNLNDLLRSSRETTEEELFPHSPNKDLRRISNPLKPTGGQFDRYDRGHPFFLRKELKYEFSHPEVFLTSPLSGTKFWRGPLFVGLTTDDQPANVWPIAPEINTGYYAPRFINQTNPTVPIAGIGQFLGEMERLPKFFFDPAYLEHKINAFRLLGGDYLNVAFGWIPFVKDLQKAASIAIRANEYAKQIYRDSGFWVRRKRKLEPMVTTSVKRYRDFTPYRFQYLDSGPADDFLESPPGLYGPLEVVENRSETYSFSAAFQYFIEGDGTFLSEADERLKAVDRLLGIKPTPSVLYELMPYSWLLDWVTNVGDVVSNWTQFMDERLVMPYCYLMRETRIDKIGTAGGLHFYSIPGTTAASTVQTTVQKERVRGTPYGFGLSPDSFSPLQWSILAALGLSKGPRRLP